MKKIYEKIMAMLTCIALILPTFAPISVLATGSELVINYHNTGHGHVEYTVDGTNWVSVSENKSISDLDTSVNDLQVRLVPDEGYRADTEHMQYREENTAQLSNVSSDMASALIGPAGYTVNSPYLELINVEFVSNSQNHDDEDDDPFSPRVPFDGSAYFIWECDSSICYHKFTNLTGEEVNGGYEINYVKLNDLTDQSSNNKAYTWGQENANWVLAREIEDNGVLDTSKLTKGIIFGDSSDPFDAGIQLDPAGAENGNSSICTNGDMNFRACIIKDNYEAVKFNNVIDDYTYFPGFWDPAFFASTIDVTDTTKDSPAEYDVYLLEPSITFETADNSKSTITSVKALDVNSKAVDIVKSGSKFTIKFNSNYYDSVVFELTSADGNKEYLRIARVSMYVNDDFRPNSNDSHIIANLLYPPTSTYNDFEVVATVINKDGSETTSVVSAKKGELEDPRLAQGVVDDYTYESGKGLHLSQYAVSVDKENTVGVYFTVIKKGALSSDNYGGTFSGSKKGTYYSLKARKVIYE